MAIKRMGKTLSAREQKKQVMEWTGWTSEEYQRQYDILRNRVRAYQKITGSERKRNVADILAREARRRFYSAGRSTPLARSGEAEIIFSTPSISSGKRGRVAAPTSERINIENFAVSLPRISRQRWKSLKKTTTIRREDSAILS